MRLIVCVRILPPLPLKFLRSIALRSSNRMNVPFGGLCGCAETTQRRLPRDAHDSAASLQRTGGSGVVLAHAQIQQIRTSIGQ